jgi:hypothetical protein
MVSTKTWGKHLWKSIHYIALGYPDFPTPEQAKAYKDFYINLYQVIPCLKCAINYKKHVQELPIDLTNKMTLFDYTVKLHNIVNRSLNKAEWSTIQALKVYTNDTDPTTAIPWSLYFLIGIAILIAVLCLRKARF